MGEFEGSDEAGLLVQAAEVADKVDDNILFLEGFAGCSLNCHQHVTRVCTYETHHYMYHRSGILCFEMLQN